MDFAISEIKKNSRRFAKRQTTWFKKDESIIWFDIESEIETIIKVIEENIKLKTRAELEEEVKKWQESNNKWPF